MKTKWVQPVLGALRTKLSFVPIAAVFVFLSGRLALAGKFPMAFDESFHVGLIKLYGHHLNPFLSAQPVGADAFGAVARDPSYLYHYLMSFPLRLISLFIHSESGQVIALRGINIGLGIASLYMVYQLAKRCGLGNVSAYIVTLALAATPVFYDVASQVNYDNLMILLGLIAVALTWDVTTAFRAKQVPVQKLTLLLVVVLSACLVKYAFLPILLALGLYVVVVALYSFGVRRLVQASRQAFGVLTPARKALLVAVVIVTSVLWAQRYAVNVVAYGTPHPQCGAVLSVAQCSNYAPWYRNYQLHASNTASTAHTMSSAVEFTRYWSRMMYFQIFALVQVDRGTAVYTVLEPARQIGKLAVVVGMFGIVATYRSKSHIRRPWALLALVGLTYVAVLWGQNYGDFRHLGFPVAIQARYLLPVLPLLYIAAGAGFSSMWTLSAQLSFRKQLSTLADMSLARLAPKTWS